LSGERLGLSGERPGLSGQSTEPDEVPLPPSIELAWGLRPRAARGPSRGLTLDLVVAAGIKVAQTEGLGALSMHRVARELGVATMSLYRYVAAKDELLTLMVDTGLGRPPEVVPGDDWRRGLTRWAVGVRTAYYRHPWALRVPISAPPLAPNNVRWLEAALRCLEPVSLSEQQKVSTVLLLSGFVRNEATLVADITAGSAGESGRFSYGAALSRLTDASLFPAIHRAVASGVFDDADEDPHLEFNFGLACILDGLEALVQREVGQERLDLNQT
jgi:AcrR family transcriptional regulator